VRRFFIFLALLWSSAVVSQSRAQVPPPTANDAHADTQTQQIAPELTDAEAAIVKSDWKTAAAKLDAYLTSHTIDARALFDAGYVADNRAYVFAALESFPTGLKRRDVFVPAGVRYADPRQGLLSGEA